jgi:hypothetical protein
LSEQWSREVARRTTRALVAEKIIDPADSDRATAVLKEAIDASLPDSS